MGYPSPWLRVTIYPGEFALQQCSGIYSHSDLENDTRAYTGLFRELDSALMKMGRL